MNLRNFSSIDIPLMVGVGILIIFGLVTIYSISPALFQTQLIFTIFSLIIFLIITQLNFKVLGYYSKLIYVFSIIVLIILLFVGTESRGSVRWFEIFGLNIQISEILKPFLAIAFASFLAGLHGFSLKSFLSSLVLLGPIVFLIFLQPDLGNALIYIFVTLGALVVYGFPFRYFLLGFILWLLSLPFFWTILHDYQRNRLLAFIDPARDPLNTSYNAIQAIIAVGSGMLIGRGFGQGTQAELLFLPEQHTDFIFATISEELGFIGALIMIITFAFILYRIYAIIKNSQEKFNKIFQILVFLVFFVQIFINVAMNIGLLPIVGITLPFVSYGGSSLLSSSILLGLLFASSKKSKEEVFQIS